MEFTCHVWGMAKSYFIADLDAINFIATTCISVPAFTLPIYI
jgi:hypothetical protein